MFTDGTGTGNDDWESVAASIAPGGDILHGALHVRPEIIYILSLVRLATAFSHGSEPGEH